MSGRAAPWVFITYSHDSPEHSEQVREFATFLRARIGLDVRLDQWDDHVRRDWSMWATENLQEADFIVVIASPEYKRRAEGTAAPSEGRGAQFEAAIIRNHLTENLRRGVERVLPVVLPGRSVEEIPSFLNPYSTTRFRISEFTEEGISGLLAAITGRPRYPMPERGVWRDGANGDRPRTQHLNEMDWLDHSTEIRAGSAQIEGVQYENSIVLRPTSAMTEPRCYVDVDLGGAYQRMKSVVGVLDDAAEPYQVGQFRIYVDGRLRREGKVAKGKPATVELDVAGATRLRLEMYRPPTSPSPLRPAPGGPARLPELAWGDPAVS